MATYERFDESLIEELLNTRSYSEDGVVKYIVSEQTEWADDGEHFDSCWLIFRELETGYHFCAWITRDREGMVTYPDYCVMVQRVDGIGINWVPTTIYGGKAERV